MASTYTTTCPDCGAENDSNDLFCKDCGSSLVGVGAASQQTAAFTPVSSASETQTTAIAPAPAPVSVSSTPQYSGVPAGQPATYYQTPQPESSRGAVLGWLAMVLIAVIVGAYFWTSVISDATRDRVTGIF